MLLMSLFSCIPTLLVQKGDVSSMIWLYSCYYDHLLPPPSRSAPSRSNLATYSTFMMPNHCCNSTLSPHNWVQNLSIMLWMNEWQFHGCSRPTLNPPLSELSYLFQWKYVLQKGTTPPYQTIAYNFHCFSLYKPQGNQTIWQLPYCLRQVAQNTNNVLVTKKATKHIWLALSFYLNSNKVPGRGVWFRKLFPALPTLNHIGWSTPVCNGCKLDSLLCNPQKPQRFRHAECAFLQLSWSPLRPIHCTLRLHTVYLTLYQGKKK